MGMGGHGHRHGHEDLNSPSTCTLTTGCGNPPSEPSHLVAREMRGMGEAHPFPSQVCFYSK